eukprot:COSAG01_NODE_2029_length_8590_cov_5.719501_2_plen_105_part_00
MMLADAWLNTWAGAANQQDGKYVGVYLGLSVATVLIGGWRALMFFGAALRSSSALHHTGARPMLRARSAEICLRVAMAVLINQNTLVWLRFTLPCVDEWGSVLG